MKDLLDKLDEIKQQLKRAERNEFITRLIACVAIGYAIGDVISNFILK